MRFTVVFDEGDFVWRVIDPWGRPVDRWDNYDDAAGVAQEMTLELNAEQQVQQFLKIESTSRCGAYTSAIPPEVVGNVVQ
jgi:hypothetical protein